MSGGRGTVSLRQLEIFHAIVQAGSFSKATALTNLSQPTLSQQLAALEDALQVQLILRGRKAGIELTPAGAYWVTRAAEMLGTMEAALTHHQTHFVDPGIVINFGTTPSLQGRFDGLAAAAALRLPHIRALNIMGLINSRQVADALLTHRINIGIASRALLDEQKSSLSIEPLCEDKIVWAVPRAVPPQDVLRALRGDPIAPAHTCLHRYVTVTPAPPWHARTSDWFRHRLPFAQPFFGAGTHQSAVQIAATGSATCHMPLTLLANLPQDIRARLNYFDIGEIAREVCLAYPRHLASIKAFTDYAEEVRAIFRGQVAETLEFAPLCTDIPLAILRDRP